MGKFGIHSTSAFITHWQASAICMGSGLNQTLTKQEHLK